MNKIKIILCTAVLFLGLTSCESYFEDINNDPNNPLVVTPNVILPQVQTRLAYSYAGEGALYTGVYTQHLDGLTRQFAVFQNYGIQPADVNSLVADNMYSGVLMDNRQMFRFTEENGDFHYTGIGKAIEAFSMLFVTDLFGDLPYAEAFNGTDNLQPAYDSQESIYNAVFSLLDEAESLLNGDAGTRTPAGDDFFYGGNAGAWLKFINSLRARAYLHLSKVDASNYQRALDALAAGGFESSDDDTRLPFTTASTGSSPMYQYIEQRDDADVSVNYTALLAELNDPRADTYGAPMDVPGHPIFVRDRRTPLLTYTETKFIEAEALVQTGQDATDAYLEAIRSSFEEAEADGYEDYIAQDAIKDATFENIMTQKYIALFMQAETFNDWRRTGIPELTPNTGTQIPRRLPYPQTEYDLNSNVPSPADVTIFSRVWWDK
ncbi:MAG: SusD/RagB family nutrient-binding outer membrane lipoprotein [Bacteroidota bacterium]